MGLSIGDVTRKTGIEASTIRYYESIGLLPEPARISGRRTYSEEIFSNLALIQSAKQSGFTLREIGRLLYGFPEGTPVRDRWRIVASPKVRQVEQELAELERIRARLDQVVDCRCDAFTECAEVFSQRCW